MPCQVYTEVDLAFDNLSILCNGLLMYFFYQEFIDFWALEIRAYVASWMQIS